MIRSERNSGLEFHQSSRGRSIVTAEDPYLHEVAG